MPEVFDLVTIDQQPLGKTALRGSELGQGEYHVVVMAVMVNPEGKILITKRSQNKTCAGNWECTAGSVIAGEHSKQAMIREIQEEIGLSLTIDADRPTAHYIEDDAIFDIWLMPVTCRVEELTLQSEEVDEARYATIAEMETIIASGKATRSLAEIVRLYHHGLICIDAA